MGSVAALIGLVGYQGKRKTDPDVPKNGISTLENRHVYGVNVLHNDLLLPCIFLR